MPISILINRIDIFLHNRTFVYIRMAEQLFKHTEALLINTLRDLALAIEGSVGPLCPEDTTLSACRS